jgi:hypothetical protein
MTLSDSTLFAVRERLETVALNYLIPNPLTSDPDGLVLARRIGRIKRWMGQTVWDDHTAALVSGFRLKE